MNTAILELAKASSECDGESDDMKRLEKTLFGERPTVYTTEQVRGMLTHIMMLGYSQGWTKEEITPVLGEIDKLLCQT